MSGKQTCTSQTRLALCALPRDRRLRFSVRAPCSTLYSRRCARVPLPPPATLKAFFEQFGPVESLTLRLLRYDPEKSRGFAHVRFGENAPCACAARVCASAQLLTTARVS